MAVFARHPLTEFTIEALASVAHEISLGVARKRAEGALRTTGQTLQALVQASPLAINVLDRNGSVTMWNPACERIFGWSAQEVLGRPNPTVPEEEQESSRRLFKESLEGRMFTNLELRRWKKDGSPLDISLSTAPLYDVNDNLVASMAIIADISDRKRVEQFRKEYLHNISHDLRNPLSVILGQAYLLEELALIGKVSGQARKRGQAVVKAAQRIDPGPGGFGEARGRAVAPRKATGRSGYTRDIADVSDQIR